MMISNPRTNGAADGRLRGKPMNRFAGARTRVIASCLALTAMVLTGRSGAVTLTVDEASSSSSATIRA